MTTNILMIRPDPVPCGLQAQLAEAGYSLQLKTDLSSAMTTLAEQSIDLVLLDADLAADIAPVVAQLRQAKPDSPIITMVSGNQSAQASEAMRQGAMDYLLRPFTTEQLISAVQHALSLNEPLANMIVASPVSRQLLLLAQKAAQTDASILIGGESGTGKECLARFIHDNSPRAKGPYVAVNCAAIPETMLEATLFGFTKGAFTGAVQNQVGKFELANGGTLLLDEISEMSLPLQAKLLRVLQEREVERLGSNQKIKLDVRVIAATNKDLRQEAANGTFREDLFYRLDVLPLCWPPLRERPEDILPLAKHFLTQHGSHAAFELHPEAARALLDYRWPGNVRELSNTIQRSLILAKGLVIREEDLMLPSTQVPETSQFCLQQSRRSAEFQHVLDTLRRFNGHRQDTARALGVTTRALRYKLAAMREQGIDINRIAVGG